MRKLEIIQLHLNVYQNKLLKTPNQNIPEEQKSPNCLSIFSRSACALKRGKSHHYTTGKAWFSGRRKRLAGRSGRQCLGTQYIRITMADFVKNRPKMFHEFDLKLIIIPLLWARFSFSFLKVIKNISNFSSNKIAAKS